MNASRAVLVLVAALGITQAGWGGARAATPGLVVEAESGKVIFAERATEPWYPASVTKLMTVYVALDLVRQRKVSMDTLLAMSPEAAAQPPSKIGLKVGMTMTLENALKIIMVKSANDIAHMIGDNLGGTVEGFADLMNAASRRLGMRESRWVNPSGLPDDRQQSSARDMAVLARALINEFPEHEHLFYIGAVKLGNKVMRNHNGLLGRYPGVDGMKTGFICSGGFNIVASATQNGRRIITVVFGYPSARERDLRAADLFDHGFASFGGLMASRVEELPPSGIVTAQNMRPFVCGGRRAPQEEDETAVAAGPGGADGGNPIASFFSQSPFASAASTAPALGSRRTLGPRVAFAPIPVWTGARPGAEPDDEDATPKPTRLAAKPVRTKKIGPGSGEPVPVVARAFTSGASPSPEGEPAIDALRAKPRPAASAALKANLDAKPAAEVKPRPGAIGPGLSEGAGRRNLGGIPLAPKPAEGPVAGLNPDGGKPAAKVRRAKPETEPAKRAAAKPAGSRPSGAAKASAD